MKNRKSKIKMRDLLIKSSFLLSCPRRRASKSFWKAWLPACAGMAWASKIFYLNRQMKIEGATVSHDNRLSRPHRLYRCGFLLAASTLFLLLSPTAGSAQQEWYYHTVHSNSFSALGGRTVKLNYEYQMSRTRQLKVTGMYVYDKFDLDRDQVKSDLYGLHFQFQYHLFEVNKLFVKANAGFGGYMLNAQNLLEQEHDEVKLSFMGGFQAEYFIQRSTLALVLDYDILWLAFSDLYEFLHLPNVGVRVVF